MSEEMVRIFDGNKGTTAIQTHVTLHRCNRLKGCAGCIAIFCTHYFFRLKTIVQRRSVAVKWHSNIFLFIKIVSIHTSGNALCIHESKTNIIELLEVRI